MPLYICNTKTDALNSEMKHQISDQITHIHCDVTGAPAIFVHVVFLEESQLFPPQEKVLAVRGTIRKGRSMEQKANIATRIEAALAKYGKLAADQVEANIQETPASWVLEGGEIMPEPGEEEAWFAAHAAKREQAH